MKKFAAILILLFSIFFFTGQTEAASSEQLIIINKANNKLAYFNGGKLVKTFKVATGRQRSYTPEGKFKIVQKIVNRPYYKGKIPGGDARNPLGDRWMGFNAKGTNGNTYAIHGNNKPSSIGTYASSGCIRMYDNEVRWLYSQVKMNTPLIITYTSKSFDSIAVSNGYVVNSKISKLTVSKNSPQLKNTTLTLTASISQGVSPMYKFTYAYGNKWTTIKDYSTSKTVAWKPVKPGTYRLRVHVKSKYSKNKYDDEKIITYNVYEPAILKSVKTDKASPQLKNTKITISALSNSKTDNLYEFTVIKGSKSTLIQPYSPKSQTTWTPSVAGKYKILIQVKHKWSKNKADHSKELSYEIKYPAVS